jgi:import inner membrane translocase subunit TIM44
MRSLRPTLRLTQMTLRIQTRSTLHISHRPSIFPSRPSIVSLRYYTAETKREPPKNEQEHKAESEEKEGPKKHYKEDTGPPPDPNKSPFQVFVDTFKSELSKSRELQETVKALQDESGKIGDSEALRRAKEAYAKARVSHNLW